MSSPTMEEFDPGDPQGGKRTSTTRDQHDPGKVQALEGNDGPNLKEIGAKTNKNNKNGQTGLIGIDSDDMKILWWRGGGHVLNLERKKQERAGAS